MLKSVNLVFKIRKYICLHIFFICVRVAVGTFRECTGSVLCSLRPHFVKQINRKEIMNEVIVQVFIQ